MPNYNSGDLHEGKISVSGNDFFHESQLSNDQLLGSFSPLPTIEIPSSHNYLSLPGLQPISDASSTSSIFASASTTAMHGDTTIEQLYAQNFFAAQRYSNDNERKRPTIRSDIGLGEYPTIDKKMKNIVGTVEKRISEQTRGKQLLKSEKKRLLEPTKAKQQQFVDRQVENKNRTKKSQKIGDRITTLQKLVSSFGKTDNASVLKEASDHIKMLHNQIQILTNPYFRSDAFLHYYHLQGGTEEINNGLRKRGLCLVPVSFTHKIIKQEIP
ncbi:hypothetical protein MKW98_007975 [Papaver atlanticum]|uniref:BHLH domain-containing protein n=1 Tax=Papaver atlanticum TaxID=357466 RepID=A0AAD4S6P9_9MAGN|nr:hypothetical protein MKW98_007975 [Papaver atlanticum]